MRKVTQEAAQSFKYCRPFRKQGTQVNCYKDETVLLLHSNKIAWKNKDGFFVSAAGWLTNTTKERLNGLPNVHIQQINHVWYLNGHPWDGKAIKIS